MVTGGFFSLFVRVDGAGRRNVLQEIPAAKSYRTCFRLFFSGFPQTARRPAQRERVPGFMSCKRAATQRIETMGGNQRPGLAVSWVT
jgi:hypothetical protein